MPTTPSHRTGRSGLGGRAALSIGRPLLLAALAASVVFAGLVVANSVSRDGRASTESQDPWRSLAEPRHDGVSAPLSVPHPPDVEPPGPPGRWRSVLADLDRLRARAWQTGRPVLLRRVYTASSPELVRDQAMLREYVDRGLTVGGVRLAFGEVRVARGGPGVVHLRVVDQLRPVTAWDSAGNRFALPRDRPTRHTILLRHGSSGWRVADVRLCCGGDPAQRPR